MSFKINSNCTKSISSYSSSLWILVILSCYYCLATMLMTNVNGQIILSPVDDKRNFNREFLPFGKRAASLTISNVNLWLLESDLLLIRHSTRIHGFRETRT
uniref:Uncharacterized protein n=1 Tax=Meloidogyne enterolobii TaxID=390850 RepID=A0A6V7XHZ5_MELEN|nr:unnamed protein product [Meloidogyne enterolobii]